MVFKKGSETDLTMGRLVSVEKNPPPGWYEDGEETNISFGYSFEEEESNFMDENLAPCSVPSLSSTSPKVAPLQVKGRRAFITFSTSSGSGRETVKMATQKKSCRHLVWQVVVANKHTEFGALGDSGSLVYAIEAGTYVPLGIYLGAPEAWREFLQLFRISRTFCL